MRDLKEGWMGEVDWEMKEGVEEEEEEEEEETRCVRVLCPTLKLA